MALLDAYGRPVRTQELTREKAAPSLTGIRTLWDQTVAHGLTPQRLASLLQAAAQGDHYEYLTLAEEMEERDLHYACELGKRKLAVARLPVTVEAYSDSAADKKLADEVRALVRRPGFRGLIKDLLDGIGKGYSVVEIVWERSASRWTPSRYEWRDPRFFQFDPVARREIRLRDEADMMEGLPLAPFGFITHVPKIKTGLPIRGGLARLAAWAYMCKGYTVKDWLAFAEVFGMPLRLGKYDSGATSDDIGVLKTAVANLGIDAAAVFPKSMEVELVEASAKGGSAEFFRVLANYLDDQTSKGILGQTASSSGTPGKLGNEELQAEVRDDIRDDDAEQLEETLQRDLVKAFIDLNHGPQENYPVLQLRAPDAEDIKALVEGLAKMVPLGLRVEQSVVRDKLGLPDPDPNAKPEDLLGGSSPPPAAPPALNRALNREQAQEFADQQAIDEAVDGLSAEDLQTQMEGVLKPVIDMIRAGEGFGQIQERLAGDLPELGTAAVEAMIARAIFVAEMWGGLSAGNE